MRHWHSACGMTAEDHEGPDRKAAPKRAAAMTKRLMAVSGYRLDLSIARSLTGTSLRDAMRRLRDKRPRRLRSSRSFHVEVSKNNCPIHSPCFHGS